MVSAKLTRRFKKWKLYFSPQKKNNDRIFSFAWNIVYWLLKRHCFEFFGGGKYGLFWAKKLMQILYSLLKSSCFELFGNGRYGLFLRQKVNEKMIFTNYWVFLFWTFWGEKYGLFWGKNLMGRWYLLVTEKVLVLSFSVIENAVFFGTKSYWKDDIYWLLKSSCFGLPKSSCFELFGDGKYGLVLAKKLM